jgi:cytochrome c oxidase subunit 2
MAAAAAGSDKTWTKDEIIAHGKDAYEKHCAACHQPDGKGVPPAFPALAGSKIVNGPLLSPEGKLIPDSHVDRVMNGKPGTAMQAFKTTLSDTDIAAIVTYERNAFGNAKGDMIQPAQIKALR